MKKIVIIGGGAGGAGAAAKCRRLDETAQITVYEKSGFASYSNCGLPYYFSHKIKNFDSLILNTPEALKTNYNFDVFVKHEVFALDVPTKTIKVRNLLTGTEFSDNYDVLIIAAGAPALRPNIPGLAESNNVFSLKTPDDILAVDEYLKKHGEPEDVVIVGGGFIGVEIAENFKIRGVKNVTIIDAQDQLFLTVDKDIAAWGHKALLEKGITLKLQKSLASFADNGKTIVLADGEKIKTDLTFLTIGVRPEVEIYRQNGIVIGTTGGIKTDKYQATNIKDIYAIGDIAETFDLAGNPVRIALATPASRQAIVAANHIYQINDEYKGSQGTNAISIFETTIASIGKTEKQLQKEEIKYHKVVVAKQNKLGLLGGQFIWLKLLFTKEGVILGAQAVGPESTEKRITYLAIVMYAKQTVFDLVEYQVAYNPVVDNSFDVINMAGRAGRLVLEESYQIAFVEDVETLLEQGWTILDVRKPGELTAMGQIPGSINIPWDQLRYRIKELDLTKKYLVHCRSGARSYNATLILQAHGFKKVKNLAGGYEYWMVYQQYHNL
ncbi:NADH oxidase [Spiroplasma syrphidicola EA-1]|uniref:NADH oxidase n=1 Tax=Spiroplasma syrphidicola EA-1 TaxID=1276229 RepID=R4UKR6_9MOLU|nr:FAD-dependent oxidoreductase [Spiroplasma syrphidicola]AGM25861.1 NADH oxidase [Spiroplasma syrphidicola EA-1]